MPPNMFYQVVYDDGFLEPYIEIIVIASNAVDIVIVIAIVTAIVIVY